MFLKSKGMSNYTFNNQTNVIDKYASGKARTDSVMEIIKEDLFNEISNHLTLNTFTIQPITHLEEYQPIIKNLFKNNYELEKKIQKTHITQKLLLDHGSTKDRPPINYIGSTIDSNVDPQNNLRDHNHILSYLKLQIQKNYNCYYYIDSNKYKSIFTDINTNKQYTQRNKTLENRSSITFDIDDTDLTIDEIHSKIEYPHVIYKTINSNAPAVKYDNGFNLFFRKNNYRIVIFTEELCELDYIQTYHSIKESFKLIFDESFINCIDDTVTRMSQQEGLPFKTEFNQTDFFRRKEGDKIKFIPNSEIRERWERGLKNNKQWEKTKQHLKDKKLPNIVKGFEKCISEVFTEYFQSKFIEDGDINITDYDSFQNKCLYPLVALVYHKYLTENTAHLILDNISFGEESYLKTNHDIFEQLFLTAEDIDMVRDFKIEYYEKLLEKSRIMYEKQIQQEIPKLTLNEIKEKIIKDLEVLSQEDKLDLFQITDVLRNLLVFRVKKKELFYYSTKFHCYVPYELDTGDESEIEEEIESIKRFITKCFKLYKDLKEGELTTLDKKIIEDLKMDTQHDDIFKIQECQKINIDDVEYAGRYLNYKNGIYDTLEKKLIPHTPEITVTHYFNTEYKEPEAEDLDYMNKIMYNFYHDELDKEHEESLKTSIFKMLQDVLLGRQSDNFYWLTGDPGCGKSSLIRIAQELSGNSYSTISLDVNDEEGFSTSNLYNKKLYINSDVNSSGSKGSNKTFIKILSHETISINRKFAPVCNFRPYANTIIASNGIDSDIITETGGLKRRLISINLIGVKREESKQIGADGKEYKFSFINNVIKNEKFMAALHYYLLNNRFEITHKQITDMLNNSVGIDSLEDRWFLEDIMPTVDLYLKDEEKYRAEVGQTIDGPDVLFSKYGDKDKPYLMLAQTPYLYERLNKYRTQTCNMNKGPQSYIKFRKILKEIYGFELSIKRGGSQYVMVCKNSERLDNLYKIYLDNKD
jgi:energy-coupling factor transporter ATP-binding protein EcfA2